MKYNIEVRSILEFGQRKDENGKPHQEDSLFPAQDQHQPSDRVFVLCDGMGGHAAGEVASATVCDAMSKSLLPLRGSYSENDISTAVSAAYDALDAIADNAEGKSKMGTTMTCLVLHEGGATIAHMGDSRVYHIRPGKNREDTKILFQTRDHSLVNDLIAVGEITPEEAKTHPRKNVITRALQPHVENRQQADIKTTVDVKPGDWFYLCTDGMLEQMDDSTIRFIFSETTGDIDSKVEMLTKATLENRDNHTAFLIHILDVEDPLPVKEVTTNAISPLMGIIEDEPATCQTNDTAADKSTEVTLDGEESGNGKCRCFHAINPWIKIKYIGILLLAIAVLVAGAFFVKSHFPSKPDSKGKTEKTEQRTTRTNKTKNNQNTDKKRENRSQAKHENNTNGNQDRKIHLAERIAELELEIKELDAEIESLKKEKVESAVAKIKEKEEQSDKLKKQRDSLLQRFQDYKGGK